jgi:hypothetical protein
METLLAAIQRCISFGNFYVWRATRANIETLSVSHSAIIKGHSLPVVLLRAANTSESPKTLKRALGIKNSARRKNKRGVARAHNVSALMLDFICTVYLQRPQHTHKTFSPLSLLPSRILLLYVRVYPAAALLRCRMTLA